MTRTRGRPARVPRTRRAPGATALASVVLVTLAACGDGADTGTGTEESSGAEAWASDVCGAVAQWQGELKAARATITDVANLSAAALEDALHGVGTATEELVADLGGLEAPGTEAGDRAREELTSLSAALDEQRQALADTVTTPAAGVDERRDQVAAAAVALRAMVTQTQQTVQELRNLDGAEELSRAFADAPACQEIR